MIGGDQPEGTRRCNANRCDRKYAEGGGDIQQKTRIN